MSIIARLRRVSWLAVASVVLVWAAVATAILDPERQALALVLVGSSISSAILSYREQ